MAGISSKALNAGGNGPDCGCPNKKGFNGNEIQQKEFSDGSGLDVYDFNARTYDQQIGRFIQIDPKANEAGQESLSPYHFGINNPVRYNDPTGNCPVCVWAIIEVGKAAVAAYVAYKVVDANKENIQELADNISSSIRDRNLSTQTQGNNPPDDQTNTPQTENGRAKNKPKPDPEAAGDHSTFKRDQNGDIYQYEEWKQNPFNPFGYDSKKKFAGGKPDGSQGKPHHDKQTGQDIETPQITEKIKVDGSKKPKEVTRPPKPEELPANKRWLPTITGS